VMKFVAVVLLLSAVLCGALVAAKGKAYDLNKHPRALFAEWQLDHPMIKFANEKERAIRYKVFANNVEKIKSLNEKHAPRTKFMINKFTHLSEQEFNKMYLNNAMPKDFKYDGAPGTPMLPEQPLSKLAALPSSFDWRTHSPPVVTKVKDQGQCGSCWSFSTTGNVEGQWALSGHALISLSEQQLVDCDHTCIKGVCDAGCDGGLMANAFTYIIKNKGLEAETTYPYTAQDGKCHFNPAKIVADIDNFTFVPKKVAQMEFYVVNTGPMSIAADASMWQYYYEGVWYFPCGTQLDHGILIVGYGVETDIFGQQMPYWIIKNSWGGDWGVDGYILIEKGDDVCGIQQYPITSLINKNATRV